MCIPNLIKILLDSYITSDEAITLKLVQGTFN